LKFQRVFTVSVCMAFWGVRLALAQAPGPANLSDPEKAAIGSILDLLTTKAGADLKDSIVHEIDGLPNSGKSAESVVGAVKMGAGPKLSVFQDILVSKCLGAGGGYCRLAALPAPQPPNSSIQTSSTGAGASGGGGGSGFGGSSQTSFRHNGQNYLASNLLSGNNSDQQFSVAASSFGASPFFVSTGSSAPTIATPGPQAGAGLGSALVLAVIWLLAKTRSCGIFDQFRGQKR
jgi:hypothetical protein